MKKYFLKSLLSTLSILLLNSCSKNRTEIIADNNGNKVLLLKVDYTTNKFEGGKELIFTDSAATFTVANEYKAPGDFGNIKLIYRELEATLFDGTIIWSGTGKMNYPQNLQGPEQFNSVATADFVSPGSGFENVFNPGNKVYNYTAPWSAIQKLVKVRTYLKAYPAQSVKLFLYAPSVGIGNPAEWDWIFFIKN